MQSKNVLIVYYSLTGQTQRVIDGLQQAMNADGHYVETHALEPLEPWDFPLPKTTFLWRNFLCWIGVDMNMPVHPLPISVPHFTDFMVFSNLNVRVMFLNGIGSFQCPFQRT